MCLVCTPIPRVLNGAHEYLSFIALIGALFVVSGGIHISVKGEATPMANVIFLLVGALLANVLGTTGASMLLIRPWIRMNISAQTPTSATARTSWSKPSLTNRKSVPPTFLGYVFRFTLPFMMPMLVIVWLIFFR